MRSDQSLPVTVHLTAVDGRWICCWFSRVPQKYLLCWYGVWTPYPPPSPPPPPTPLHFHHHPPPSGKPLSPVSFPHPQETTTLCCNQLAVIILGNFTSVSNFFHLLRCRSPENCWSEELSFDVLRSWRSSFEMSPMLCLIVIWRSLQTLHMAT